MFLITYSLYQFRFQSLVFRILEVDHSLNSHRIASFLDDWELQPNFKLLSTYRVKINGSVIYNEKRFTDRPPRRGTNDGIVDYEGSTSYTEPICRSTSVVTRGPQLWKNDDRGMSWPKSSRTHHNRRHRNLTRSAPSPTIRF